MQVNEGMLIFLKIDFFKNLFAALIPLLLQHLSKSVQFKLNFFRFCLIKLSLQFIYKLRKRNFIFKFPILKFPDFTKFLLVMLICKIV